MDEQKKEALKVALGQIEKQFGKGSVMFLGDEEARTDIEAVSTGSLSLDIALGIGGLPKGRVIEIYGPESSGKTTMTLHVIAEMQKLGGTAAFIDAEHALDPSYARKLGVNTDDLLISQPDTGEQALEITDMLVRSGSVDVLVVDSVAALTPKAEIEGEMGASHMGLQARLMSQALRKLTSNINNESSPRWSPDGKRITFVSSSDDGNGSEIYIYWVDSKQYSVISQLNKNPSNLKWSPSGEYIGFSMFMTDNVLSLVTPPKKPKDANWAPPARITDRLKHESDGSGYIDKGFNHLFYISAGGGSPVQVTSESYNHKDFNWSIDSKKIIFSSNYTENWEYDFRNSEMYSIKINGSSLTQLTNRKGPDYGGVFSPDGKKIAYLGFTDKVQTYQINKLYLMNADGSAKKEIKTTLDRNMSSLKWASDGKGLYFKYDNFGNGKIGYISISGKTKK